MRSRRGAALIGLSDFQVLKTASARLRMVRARAHPTGIWGLPVVSSGLTSMITTVPMTSSRWWIRPCERRRHSDLMRFRAG